MSNRFLLPGFRAPQPRRFGIRGVVSPVDPGSVHWMHDGITWEQVCAVGGGVGAVPCDTSPMTGYDPDTLTSNVAGTTPAGSDPGGDEGEGFDAFFAYAMIECGMIGGQDHEERARLALDLAEDDIVASRLLAEVRLHQPASLDTTLGAKAALGMALDDWDAGGDPVVFVTHNVAQQLDLEIADNGRHLELKTGEKVYVFRDRLGSLAQGTDDDEGHIVLLGDVVAIEGDVETHLVPVTGVTTGTAEFNNDQIALAMRPWVIGFGCGADWYRVQGLDTP